MNSLSYDGKFPYSEIREQQREAIDFALSTLVDKGKRFCIIEAGTGVGKSAVGLTVARVLSETLPPDPDTSAGAYFLTTQKILQDQYQSDFASMVSLKSSSNYKCRFHKSNTCSESQQLLRSEEKGSKFFNTCVFNCTYKEEKKRFLEEKESVTNFPYFLTESNFSGKITKRQVLIVDEAHNAESELSRFVEVSVSEHFAKTLLNLTFPATHTQFQIFRWIVQTYLPAAQKKVSHIERMIAQFGGDKFREKLTQFQKISRQHDLLKSHVSKIETFVNMYDKFNWVFEITRTDHRGSPKATFKPIDVSPYAEESLFRLGEKIILMSATIIDPRTFCQTLGIPLEECSFISIPSPFDTKNRPIMFSPVGSMASKMADNTLPRLLEAVKLILDSHKGEKGIIHCHTYKIAKYLKYNIKDRNLRSRILIHDHTNRDEILQKHIASKKATVLLSPSMTEGVDLKGDSSRFQILCKVPYPYLGDKLVKKRMNKFPGWYNLQTAKTIIQAAGRSIRNSEDHAVTYILDADFQRFYKRNGALFSKDFKECIVR